MTNPLDPEAVARLIRQRAETVADLDRGIAQALREARAQALRDAARDVCMYCGKRALGYGEAVGPNSAGNYGHAIDTSPVLDVLCTASSIHARLAHEARHE